MTTSGLPEGSSVWLHDMGRVLARVLHTAAFRVRVHGAQRVPRTGPVVLVANHSSLVEPQLIYGMLPRRAVFFVKEELFSGPTGRPLTKLGQIEVHRGGVNRTALVTARNVLRSGGMVCVFPEGKRGHGDVTYAEGGATWLVRATGAVVLPVASRGTLRGEGNRRRFRPRVDLLVGEPFHAEVGAGREGLAEGTELIRGRLAELVHELDEWRAR